MYKCNNCDKLFKYNYLLLRHNNNKKKCNINEDINGNINDNNQIININNEPNEKNEDNDAIDNLIMSGHYIDIIERLFNIQKNIYGFIDKVF